MESPEHYYTMAPHLVHAAAKRRKNAAQGASPGAIRKRVSPEGAKHQVPPRAN